MSKNKTESNSKHESKDILFYASKEEEEEFLKFSDVEMDGSGNGSISDEFSEDVLKACDINMSNDEELGESGNYTEDEDENENYDDDKVDEEQVRPFDRKTSKENGKFYNERNKCTIFVGNLTSKTTKKVLLQLFNSKKAAGEGAVETIRIRGAVPEDKSLNSNAKKRAIILKKFADNENQVLCAFVVLKNEEHVENCLKLNGHLVDGKHIRVDRLKGKKMNFKSSNCIFIGNLPYSVNEEVVRKSFEKCGEIVNVRLVRNKVDGSIKGIGFVEFADELAVDFSLKLADKLVIENRQIRIQRWSQSKTQKDKRKKSNFSNKDSTRPKFVTPTNLKGFELKEFILSKKKKMIKKATKKKNFIKSKRERKTK